MRLLTEEEIRAYIAPESGWVVLELTVFKGERKVFSHLYQGVIRTL